MADEKKLSCKVAHGLRLMTSLEDLLKFRVICDFTIEVGGTSFPVHRAVLAACSEYFRNLLSEDTDQGIVYINGIEPGAMKVCIAFMYTGEAKLTLETIEDVLNSAEILHLDDLVELCFEFLRSNMNAENCLRMRNIVAVYENMELRQVVEHFIVDNMKEIVETGDFKQLDKSELKHYLHTCREKSPTRRKSGPSRLSPRTSPRIFLSAGKARSESCSAKGRLSRPLRPAAAPGVKQRKQQILWKAVMNWIGHDYLGRKKDLLELLKYIKVTRYPVHFLATSVWGERLLENSETCRELIAKKVLSDVNELRKAINLENCFSIYQMAVEHSSDDFKNVMEVIITFLSENLETIKKRREVELWSTDEVCLFLDSCDKTPQKEDDLWRTAKRWLKSDKERRQHAFQVIRVLNLETSTPQFVLMSVLKEPIIRESKECVEYLAKTVFHDRKQLIWSMDLSSCFTLKYLSRSYKNTVFGEVGSEVLSFLIMNFLRVVEQPEFKKITFDELLQLCKVLQKRNIHGEAKWKAIMKWVKYDSGKRKEYLPSLLQTINFERLTSNFMKQTVRTEPLVNSSAECSDIVTTAVYKMLP